MMLQLKRTASDRGRRMMIGLVSCASLLAEVGGERLLDFPQFPRLARRDFKLVLA